MSVVLGEQTAINVVVVVLPCPAPRTCVGDYPGW